MTEKFEGGIPPQEQEKTPEEIIKEFGNDFEKYLQENPDIAKKIMQDLLTMAGVSESELDKEIMKDEGYYYVVIKVPIDRLDIFGTSCGNVGNRPFTKEVIDFLKSKKVEFIIALSFNDEPKICSAAIQIDEKSGRRLEKMVNNNKGSLRGDSSNQVSGWIIYESE